MSIFSESSNSFRQQYPNENTVFVTRRHWIILIAPLLILLFFLLLPFITYAFINTASWFQVVSSPFWFLSSIWILFLWNVAFYNIMIYFLNTVILTDQRLIQNKQTGFFQYALNELRLDKIQDISVNISGALATFLNYGHLDVQSAGTEKKFHFDTLPDPKKIKKIIMEQEIKEN
jgi:succinate dehydrogenase hydrophobic anchor subunit